MRDNIMEEFRQQPKSDSKLGDGKGLEIADPSDFGISRDGDEELRPLRQRIPGTDKAVLVKPLNASEVEKYDAVLNRNAADDDMVDEMFREHIVEGPGADGLHSGLPGYLVSGLIQAVKNSSGYDVFLAVQEQRREEQEGNLQMLQNLDPEMVGKMQDLMGEMDLEEMRQTNSRK